MKKKKVLLIVLLSIVILTVILVLAMLYFLTDMFKSNKVLFSKYFSQNVEIFDIVTNSNIQKQQDLKTNHTYIMTGDLTTTVQDGTNSQEIKAVTSTRHDANTGRTYSDIVLKNEEIETLKVSYINSGDIYAIKCEDILSNYIGFRNSELKKFLQEMGMTETKNVPDSIDFIGISNIANITEEQKKHIIDTYSKVILNCISEESYTKVDQSNISIDGINYEPNAYQVTINAITLKQIIINCLTTLKDDNITLVILSNQLTSLGMANEITDITKLSEIMGKIATQMQSANIDDNMNIIITVYEDKGKTIRTEVIVNRKEKEEIESISNTIPQETEIVFSTDKMVANKLVIDRVETINTLKAILTAEQSKTSSSNNMATTKTSQIILEKSQSDTSTTNEMTLIPDVNHTQQFIIISTTMGKVENNTINNISDIILNISENGNYTKTVQSTYRQNIQVIEQVEEIPELKNSNTIIVNNYKKAQLIPFLTKVGEKVGQVLPNKMAQLGIDISVNSSNNVEKLNKDIRKVVEIVGTTGISVANANGIDISKVAIISGIRVGISKYYQLSRLLTMTNDAMDEGQQLDNQIIQNTMTLIDSMIEQ